MSSTIQILMLHSNCTFDQPETTIGQQWKTALSYLARCPSFFSAWWGRHLEKSELVTLFIDWNTRPAANAFLADHYGSFATLLEPLLATPPDLPDVADLNPISLALPGSGDLTTVSKLTYVSSTDDQRFHLLAPTFYIYVQELGAAAAAGFKGGNAAWAVDSTGARTPTLWLLMSWESVDAEQRSEKTLETANGLNMRDAFLKKMLEQADPGAETHHVAWEMLTLDIVESWKDPE